MSGRILIVDDVATHRIVLKVKLAGACYEILQAGTGAEALRLARAGQADLILLESALPDLDGHAVLRTLRADPATRDLPVVMLSAADDGAARLAALRAGADDFLTRPLEDAVLMARIRSLMRRRAAARDLRAREAECRDLGFAEPPAELDLPGTIALIAPRPDAALRWRAALAGRAGPARILPMTREEALALESGPVPDLFLIAADLPGRGQGLQLMSELRSRSSTRGAAVCIVLPPAGGPEAAAMALDLGADDLLAEDFDPAEAGLRARALIRRKRAEDRQRAAVSRGLRLALIDPLTGLYNRRHALPELARITARAQAAGRHCAVMVIDIDRFKAVNDRHGHAAGDAVLAEVARRLAVRTRPGDLLARMGGEEFLFALPETTAEKAHRVAERLCRAIAAEPVALPDGAGALAVTVSIGLALSGGEEPPAALLVRADRALLAAKAEGRNQVTFSPAAA
ncbi:diguanylate cyclase domain-containing protein [Ruixingdingia sedimenti]|uniref:diguanylate cyclase n=1 Tax=Ruixingdingia sedimenti TaxID=3073604 RepID=A0ABU1F564_9RHOB|nr:diguanylate cyclase [Xinfangfangia sp. LG-4]MDR5652021.1 diguanylate cyclase [Xinfangfangia sp. LG-4]